MHIGRKPFVIFMLMTYCFGINAQSLDQLYKLYSSKNHIKQTRLDALALDAQKRMSAILEYSAKEQRASLKRDFLPQTKKASEKRARFKSLRSLLQRISPIKRVKKIKRKRIIIKEER